MFVNCAAVNCETLDDPVNGQVVLTGVSVGSTADYNCNPGYQLVGVTQRMCEMNREWSGEAPTCERTYVPCLPTCLPSTHRYLLPIRTYSSCMLSTVYASSTSHVC